MQIQQTTAVAASFSVTSATNHAAEKPAAEILAASSVKPVEATTQQAVQAVSSTTQDEEVREAIAKVNEMVSSMDRGLEFSVDEETNIKIVKVVDTQSKEVIRQMPSEEVVQISKWLDKLQGMLLRDKA